MKTIELEVESIGTQARVTMLGEPSNFWFENLAWVCGFNDFTGNHFITSKANLDKAIKTFRASSPTFPFSFKDVPQRNYSTSTSVNCYEKNRRAITPELYIREDI